MIHPCQLKYLKGLPTFYLRKFYRFDGISRSAKRYTAIDTDEAEAPDAVRDDVTDISVCVVILIQGFVYTC
jgi:hypothetical protein